jgi:hypothetical protein
MMRMTDCLPCPFCGGTEIEAHRIPRNARDGIGLAFSMMPASWAVGCPACGVCSA